VVEEGKKGRELLNLFYTISEPHLSLDSRSPVHRPKLSNLGGIGMPFLAETKREGSVLAGNKTLRQA
jgi:hypothetical protein